MFGRMPEEESFRFVPRDIKVLRQQIIGDEFRVGGGNGCLLIKRRVFNRYHPQVHPLRFLCPADYASDLYFWHRAQKMGFTARVNGNVLCGHLPYWPLSSYGGEKKE